jgi:hypothetical protein
MSHDQLSMVVPVAGLLVFVSTTAYFRHSIMLDGILVRLRVHITVCEPANNFHRVTQPSLAKRSVPSRDSGDWFIVSYDDSEVSNEVFGATGASGVFHSAHDFAIKDSTFIDVQGNYVSGRFVACDDMIVTCPELPRGSQDRQWISISTTGTETRGYGRIQSHFVS